MKIEIIQVSRSSLCDQNTIRVCTEWLCGQPDWGNRANPFLLNYK